MNFTWIHPPVNRWAKPKEIQAWLDTLSGWDQDPQRDAAIANAQSWLADAVAFEQEQIKQTGA